MPTPAWCWTRWRGSSKTSPPSGKGPRAGEQASSGSSRRKAFRRSRPRRPSPRRQRREERLTEALAAIRSSVEAAGGSAVEALDSLALEQRLAPVRKGCAGAAGNRLAVAGNRQ